MTLSGPALIDGLTSTTLWPVSTELEAVHRAFALPGRLADVRPHGSGHINDTYVLESETRAGAVRHVVQRINTEVFEDPFALMENVRRVTEHIRGKIAERPDSGRRREALSVVLTPDGRPCYIDAQGSAWRIYAFIRGTRAFDAVRDARQAREAGRTFGEFQEMLTDLPPPRLCNTIAGFHDTPARFEALREASAADPLGRAAGARPEIDFAFERKALCEAIIGPLASGRLPERVTHNDTKINNVLFDLATGEAVCAIDLDTVMPGAVAWDFGDLIRTSTCAAPEDERDLSRIEVRLDLYEAIATGYVEATRGFLTSAELQSLPSGGQVITFELGMRFLTDYLTGDCYFKTSREGHNLDRARAQFRLLARLEALDEGARAAVERAAG